MRLLSSFSFMVLGSAVLAQDRTFAPNEVVSDPRKQMTEPMVFDRRSEKAVQEKFGLQKNDQIVEIDSQKVSPIEGTAKLHADIDVINEIKVLRDGKEVPLKARAQQAHKKKKLRS